MAIDPDKNFFSHEADIGIIGRGPSLEQAFVNAAEAMFSIMADLSLISPTQLITIEFHEADVELALVTWLNLLIAQARIQGLILARFELTHQQTHWFGKAWGEAWSDKVARGTEVKGATLSMLSVKQVDKIWDARCVVDV